jgi:hypothetical protein
MKRDFQEQYNINIDEKDEVITIFEQHKWLISYWKSVKRDITDISLTNHFHFSNTDLYQQFYSWLLVDAHACNNEDGIPDYPLTKIKNKDGKERNESGSYAKKSCFVCRGWTQKYRLTTYQCHACGMPLCNPQTVGVRNDRVGLLSRTKTCLEEHLNAVHPIIKCDGTYNVNSQFPSRFKRWKAKHNPHQQPNMNLVANDRIKNENVVNHHSALI